MDALVLWITDLEELIVHRRPQPENPLSNLFALLCNEEH